MVGLLLLVAQRNGNTHAQAWFYAPDAAIDSHRLFQVKICREARAYP